MRVGDGESRAMAATRAGRRGLRFRRRGWLLAGTVLLVAFLYSQPLRTYFRTHDALDRRTAEVRALQSQRVALRRQLAHSLGGPGLSRQARRIGYVKPGEKLYIVKGIERWRREQRRRTTIGRHG